MKRKRSSNTSSHSTDLCGSFLVNVLDLSKILNGKNKSKTVHKLTCLKELLDLSPGSSSSAASTSAEDNTIVISDSDEESENENIEIDSHEPPSDIMISESKEEVSEIKETKIKQEKTLYDFKKVSRFKKLKKKSSSCSENDESEEEENDISKIKNYVKESLLKGLAINSHKFSNNDKLTTLVKKEPDDLKHDNISDADEPSPEKKGDDYDEKKDVVTTPEKPVVTSKEVINTIKRKRIRLTKRRDSSYQGKRLLRYYRNLKKRPRLNKLFAKPRITTVTEPVLEEVVFEEPSEYEIENECETSVISSPIQEQETKETAVQVEEINDEPEISIEESLPSSTTNDQDILTLSRLEELKVQITEDETTVYITILDGSTTIPDVLQVLECSTPTENEVHVTEECVEPIVISDEEVNPYFSQREYKSCYTTASSCVGTDGNSLILMIII